MREEKIIQTEEIYELAPTELELHPLASTTPRMTDVNYTALKTDIEENGQLEPITLYRGRILDGRHRWLILQELGVSTISAVKLPNNTTRTSLRKLVRSKEIRRHETPSQLAITAYKLMLESEVKISASEAAQTIGADRKKTSNAKSIASDYKRPDILETLFNGEKVDIGTPYEPYKTDSLPAILSWLKDMRKTGNKPKDIRGKVEMTEEQFANCALKLNELKGLDIKQIKHISSKLYQHLKDYETIQAELNEGA